MIDSPEAVAAFLRILERLNIPYMLGGSVASSLTGLWRATQDIDLVVPVGLHQVDELAKLLFAEYYVDSDAMRESIARGRAFNVIHFASSQKFDVFPLLTGTHYQEEFARRVETELRLPDGRTLRISAATPEDIVLAKLVGLREGGRVSDRQWNDVKGVISVQGSRLDHGYLRRWAAHLDVADLLDQALAPAE